MSAPGNLRRHDAFKVCTNCGEVWETRGSFMRDAGLSLIGYQVDFRQLTAGLFLFNHACHSTIAVRVEEFVDLYRGEVFQTRATGTDQCPGHCLHRNNLDPCPARCECAFVREIIQVLKNPPGHVDSP
jgi:hypothetical protein